MSFLYCNANPAIIRLRFGRFASLADKKTSPGPFSQERRIIFKRLFFVFSKKKKWVGNFVGLVDASNTDISPATSQAVKKRTGPSLWGDFLTLFCQDRIIIHRRSRWYFRCGRSPLFFAGA